MYVGMCTHILTLYVLYNTVCTAIRHDSKMIVVKQRCDRVRSLLITPVDYILRMFVCIVLY